MESNSQANSVISTKEEVVIEMGGTGSRIAIAQKEYTDGKISKITIIKKVSVDTQKPEETVDSLFKEFQNNDLTDIGIASFGPVCLDKSDPRYGSITTTPKENWQNFHLTKFIMDKYKAKNIHFDTDVNAAAMAEFKLGGHNAKESLAYVTVGTGIGVGLIINGKTVHGLTHPEGGHIAVKILKDDENFEGVCIFHKQCLESLVTNVSIAKRLGKTVSDLPDVEVDHPVWKKVAYYLAQLCLNLTLTLSPEVIILGGGVMNQPTLLPLIHEEFKTLLNGYVQHPKLATLENYIKKPTCGDNVALIGAALLNENL